MGRKTSEGEEYLPGQVDNLNGIRVVQISAGDSHTAALASEGQVYCWGTNEYGLLANGTTTGRSGKPVRIAF